MTSAPSSAAMTDAEKPTTPVAPNVATLRPLRLRCFLSVITSSPRARRSLVVCVCRDFGAAIEPLAHADVQTLVARVSARELHQTIGLGLRCREREPGRSPGTLPDAMRAFAREEIEAG